VSCLDQRQALLCLVGLDLPRFKLFLSQDLLNFGQLLLAHDFQLGEVSIVNTFLPPLHILLLLLGQDDLLVVIVTTLSILKSDLARCIQIWVFDQDFGVITARKHLIQEDRVHILTVALDVLSLFVTC